MRIMRASGDFALPIGQPGRTGLMRAYSKKPLAVGFLPQVTCSKALTSRNARQPICALCAQKAMTEVAQNGPVDCDHWSRPWRRLGLSKNITRRIRGEARADLNCINCIY